MNAPFANAVLGRNVHRMEDAIQEFGFSAMEESMDKHGSKALHLVKDVSVAQVLLNCGANPLSRDNHGRTPLHYANNADIARLLIERVKEGKGDINVYDRVGRTPLFTLEDDKACQVFIDEGIDVNWTDARGFTALHHSLMEGSLEKCGVLIQAGADLSLATPFDALNLIQKLGPNAKSELLTQAYWEGCNKKQGRAQ